MNINEFVSVRLTLRGRFILEQVETREIERLPEHMRPRFENHRTKRVQPDGTFVTQLWDLMAIFGPYTSLASDAAFEGNEIAMGR